MSWRVITVSSRAKLDYKMDYLVVRTQESVKRIHLSEISVLIIESTAVSLTAYLLCELSKHKINIVFCDEKRFPFSSIVPLYGSHDTSLKIRNQIKWDSECKDTIWSEIVRSKILGQSSVLEFHGKEESKLLVNYANQIVSGDLTNREGHAAKVYFNSLFGLDFSRNTENIINSALDYGYSILLSAFSRECVVNGYITQLGIFHDNMFNDFNLACDLMEPFRPFVDYKVSLTKLNSFGHDEKVYLINTLNDKIIIDGKTQHILNAIKIYTKSVFDALSCGKTSLIKFPKYELQIYENDNFL